MAQNPELTALLLNQKSLAASIAARNKVTGQTDDFQAVTAQEAGRLSEITARIKQLSPAPLAPVTESAGAEPATVTFDATRPSA